jgi:signal transduction histidine kinase
VVAVVGATAELRVSRQADVAGVRDHSRERRRDRVGRFTVVSVNAGLRRVMTLRADPVKIDWAVAALFTVTTQQAIWVADDGAGHRLGAAALALAITVPVAVRRRWPTLVGTAVPVLSAIDSFVFDGTSIGYPLANFFALYALAVWSSTRRFIAGVAAVVVLVLGAAVPAGTVAGSAQYLAVVVVVMLFVRRVVGGRERRAALAERERDVTAREAVLDERARIARELHDAIAHNVSMMVLQAGAERRVLDGHEDSTREVLEGIERSGRSALTEMRRLVGMLRSDRSEPLAPQPGIHDLPVLVSQLREAGLPIDLTVDGSPPGLPVGIELSAYRIVQEALTNVLKHAGDSHATVRVRYSPDSLELEISDDGRGRSNANISGGHGLVGMRERVALYGGQFSAGRRPNGGFAVRVLLPVR